MMIFTSYTVSIEWSWHTKWSNLKWIFPEYYAIYIKGENILHMNKNWE